MIRLKDVLKTFWRRLENILKLSCGHLCKTPWRHFSKGLEVALVRVLKNILKIPWRLLQNVFNMPWRSPEDIFARLFEDVLKTTWKCLEDVLKKYGTTEYIRLKQDVLKTSSEDVWLREVYLSCPRRLRQVDNIWGSINAYILVRVM